MGQSIQVCLSQNLLSPLLNTLSHIFDRDLSMPLVDTRIRPSGIVSHFLLPVNLFVIQFHQN